MSTVKANQRGQSLLEVMIATAVFAVGALGLLPLAFRATEGLSSSLKITQATALGDSLLASLTQQPYESTLLMVTDDPHEDGTLNLGSDGEPTESAWGTADGGFYRSWTVTEEDINTAAVGNDYKQIVVTVSWYDAAVRRVRSVSLAGGKALTK